MSSSWWSVNEQGPGMPEELRSSAESSLAAGAWPRAAEALRRLWFTHPSAANAAFLVSRFERMREHLPLSPCRLYFLRSFTLEPLVPFLRAGAFTGGIDVTAKLGDFNAYAQEVLDPGIKLYSFAPDVVILAAQTRDAAPELWEGSASAAAIESAEERVTGELRSLIASFRSR